jgi:DNA-binding MarR family transcriptional regulator
MRDEVDDIVEAWERERPDLDTAPMQVLSRLDRLAGVLAARRAAVFAGYELGTHEFDVLAALRRAGAPFELTAGELSARTYVTSGTMTSRIDRLTKRGLVTRQPDPVDGRLVRVGLTVEGRRRVDDALLGLLSAERDLLAPLDADGRAAVAAALKVLLAATGTE